MFPPSPAMHPNVRMTKAKITGNYANSVLAKTESVRLGFDEAIMLDPQGYVAECTGENLFVVRNGRHLYPATAPILEGITRDALITLAADVGYPVGSCRSAATSCTLPTKSLSAAPPPKWWPCARSISASSARARWAR